jgi:hypothetical protein
MQIGGWPSALLLAAAALAAPAAAQELSAADRAAAGFKKVGDAYMRCDDIATESGTWAFLELADLNGDGSPEAWGRESSTFCYGNTAEAFVLLTRDESGAWITLLDEIGIGVPLETRHNGWRDIEIGSPGVGPFPVYSFDGTRYVRR